MKVLFEDLLEDDILSDDNCLNSDTDEMNNLNSIMYSEEEFQLNMSGLVLSDNVDQLSEEGINDTVTELLKRFTTFVMETFHKIITSIKELYFNIMAYQKNKSSKKINSFYNAHEGDWKKIIDDDSITFNAPIPAVDIDGLLSIFEETLEILTYSKRELSKRMMEKQSESSLGKWIDSTRVIAGLFKRTKSFRDLDIFSKNSSGTFALPAPNKLVINHLYGPGSVTRHVSTREYFSESKIGITILSADQSEDFKNRYSKIKVLLKEAEQSASRTRKILLAAEESESSIAVGDASAIGTNVLKLIIKNELMLYNFFISVSFNVYSEYLKLRHTVYNIASDTVASMDLKDKK